MLAINKTLAAFYIQTVDNITRISLTFLLISLIILELQKDDFVKLLTFILLFEKCAKIDEKTRQLSAIWNSFHAVTGKILFHQGLFDTSVRLDCCSYFVTFS